MSEYESLNHTTWECKYHIVWIPKYRKKKLYAKIRKELGGAKSDGWQNAGKAGYWKDT